MRTSSGADIVIDGDVVVKIHRAGTDPAPLAARLRAAAEFGASDGPLLAPLSTCVEPAPDGRWMTRWPRVSTVAREGPLPWGQAGELLATLHTLGVVDRLPDHRGAERVGRALKRLPAGAPPVIRRAAQTLPECCRQPASPDRPVTLVHGDFHLGQLGRRTGGPWQLIDVDDLGLGDPAWDLARPAGLWAAGLIPHTDWHDFLGGYRSGAGPALPPAGDPWQVLEPFARTAVVHAAAVGVRYPGDESQAELLAACERMAG